MAAAAAEGTAALAMRAVLARAGRAAEQMVSVSVGTIELGALDCTVCYYPSRTGSSRTLLAFEGCRPSQFEYYSAEVGSYVNTSDVLKDSGSNKRLRSGPCGRWTSKACREKVRRDKLNDRFLELGTTPGKPVKADKAAIQSDDARMVTQLCAEAQQLKDTNGRLEENIEELKHF